MAFNWPISPTEGQIYTPVGGPTYVFNSPVWKAMGQGQIAIVSDSAPANPANGQLWWESDTGILFVYVNDGNSSQWVQCGGVFENTLPSPFKRTVITASTNAFQYDASTLFADVEVCGGGGGGGGSGAGSAAGSSSAGSGGGGGGYTKKLIQITPAIRAATKTIVIGAGGAPVTDGIASSYGDGTNTLTGAAGFAGLVGAFAATATVRIGGIGGSASGGEINMPGTNGTNGFAMGATYLAASTSMAMAGTGGPSAMGGGGGRGGSQSASATAAGVDGQDGRQYGGGGGGGAAINAVGSSALGGAGGIGVTVITEYR